MRPLDRGSNTLYAVSSVAYFAPCRRESRGVVRLRVVDCRTSKPEVVSSACAELFVSGSSLEAAVTADVSERLTAIQAC